MRVTFEFYGGLTRRFATPTITIDARKSDATIGDALAVLAEQHPAALEALQRTACAVGDALVARSMPATDGLRVALLPPVAGG